MIETKEDLLHVIQEYGFIPLFQNNIEGFSVEELTSPDTWFVEDKDGPWEWKGPLASSGECVYGKFFGKKNGFISLEWFYDFMNYRRDGYDFDARFNDHLASYNDQFIYNIIDQQKAILSTTLKYKTDYQKGLDTILTRLQMQCYAIIVDFEYKYDKNGKPYGWEIAKYSTPEYMLGKRYVSRAYQRTPEESKMRIFNHMKTMFPHITSQQIEKIIG